MNKRLYFLLLPVFVLIFGINYKSIELQPAGIGYEGYNISTTEHNINSFYVGLNKESNRKIKNAIRIKAWDGSAAIGCSDHWEPNSTCVYYCRPRYYSKNVKIPVWQHSFRNLRGPPAII